MLMIYEINKIRSNPKSYIPKVEKYLDAQKWLLSRYDDPKSTIKTVSYTGNKDVNNKNINIKKTTGKDVHIRNIKVAEELISILDTLTPMDTLVFDSLMYKITVSHGEYLKSVNQTGHYGPNGQTPFERLGPKGSENCGSSLIGLMVDAGVPGYGHRYNILNVKWKYISVYYIKGHPSWGDEYMVQNFRE
jgi:uncharacterized protein YkwD